MNKKLIIFIIALILLAGIVNAANVTKDDVANFLSKIDKEETKTGPEPAKTDAETGVEVVNLGKKYGYMRANIFEDIQDDVESGDKLSYDDGTWTVGDMQYRFGRDGQVLEKYNDGTTYFTWGKTEEIPSGGRRTPSMEISPELFETLDIDGIKSARKDYFGGDAFLYDDKEVIYYAESNLIETYTDYDGDEEMDERTSEEEIIMDDEGNVVSTIKTTYVDDNNYEDEEYNPVPGSIEITSAAGVTINADQNSGDVTITYADGSSDAFGGTEDFEYDEDKPYSFHVSGEFLLGAKTIHLNPSSGDIMIYEEEGDDIIIYDREGNIVAETPAMSGEDYDGISATGGFFGMESGNYLTYDGMSGGPSLIIENPEIEYDDDGVAVIITKGYSYDINYDDVYVGDTHYVLGNGQGGLVGGNYYRYDEEEGTYTTVSDAEYNKIIANRQIKISGPDGVYTAEIDENGDFITNEKGQILVQTNGEKEYLDKDSAVASKLKKSKSLRDNRGFWEGRSNWAKIGAVLGTFKSQSALTTAIWGEEKVQQWKEAVDKFFAKSYLGVEYATNEICNNEFKTIGSSAAVIETPSEIVQLIAHVEGSKTKELPDKERFYKITFRVTAPSDSELTPQLNEDGAISFNIRLVQENGEDTYVYVNQNNRRLDIHLENGESFEAAGESALLFYSEKNYETVQIDFSKRILDRTSRYRDSISRVSNRIVLDDELISNWEAAQETEDEDAPDDDSEGEPSGAEQEESPVINPDL